VVIAYKPSSPGRLEERNTRCLSQVVKRGVAAPNGDVALDAFRCDEELLVNNLDRLAEPGGGPIAGTSCLGVRRPTATLSY
jgi:hypothetical protein